MSLESLGPPLKRGKGQVAMMRIAFRIQRDLSEGSAEAGILEIAGQSYLQSWRAKVVESEGRYGGKDPTRADATKLGNGLVDVLWPEVF